MVVGIVGHSYAGKSTVANYLQEQINATLKMDLLKVVSFADPLREVLQVLTGLNNWQNRKQDVIEPWHITGRELMIKVGQGMKGILGNDVWVNAVLRENVIIDDVRFLEEAIAIKEAGGTLIHVYTSPETRFKRLRGQFSSDKELHSLIKSLDARDDVIDISCDYTIDNNGRIDKSAIHFVASALCSSLR